MIIIVYDLLIILILLIISYIDIKKKIIPDSILIIGVLITILNFILNGSKFSMNNIAGFIFGFILFLIIALLTDAMGGGDIKLMALLGLNFGLKGTIFIMFFSFVIGALISLVLIGFKIKKKTDNIAFAPFISLSTFIYMLYGNQLINFYINLFS